MANTYIMEAKVRTNPTRTVLAHDATAPDNAGMNCGVSKEFFDCLPSDANAPNIGSNFTRHGQRQNLLMHGGNVMTVPRLFDARKTTSDYVKDNCLYYSTYGITHYFANSDY